MEYPIFNAPVGHDYEVVGANAQPPDLHVGDTVRLEVVNGVVYRNNLTKGVSVRLDTTSPNVWVEGPK